MHLKLYRIDFALSCCMYECNGIFLNFHRELELLLQLCTYYSFFSVSDALEAKVFLRSYINPFDSSASYRRS